MDIKVLTVFALVFLIYHCASRRDINSKNAKLKLKVLNFILFLNFYSLF